MATVADSSRTDSCSDESVSAYTNFTQGTPGSDAATNCPNSSLPVQATEVHTTDKKLKFGHKLLKDKTCLVCGDKALGYNFNAVSCESCKAFFRRNAFKEIRGRCEGECDVTVESRSYCKKCRLQKCFAVGMKRDLILNDQQKQVRRQKIYENRLRRHGMPIPAEADTGACSGGSSPTSHTASSSSPQNVGPNIKQEDETVTHVIASLINPECLEGLSEQSRDKLTEIMKAFQASFDSPMDYQPKWAPSNTDFLNMADSSVRRLVKMAKHLSGFRKLHQEDQIALLKGAVVEVLILRSAKMFDTETGGWLINRHSAEAAQQQMVSGASFQFGSKDSLSFFHQYQRFATSLLTATRRDNIILMLLIVLVVLSPDRERLKNKELIAKAQEEYADLLKEYIQLRYPTEELLFAKALQKITDIRDLNETHTRMLMHMKIEDLEPLIVEIFDLSS